MAKKSKKEKLGENQKRKLNLRKSKDIQKKLKN